MSSGISFIASSTNSLVESGMAGYKFLCTIKRLSFDKSPSYLV